MSINKLICGASTTNQMIETVNACVDGSKALDGIKALEPIEGVTLNVTGFYAGSTVGGGQFIYDATRGKADHNGGTVIAPEAITAWDGTSADIATLLDWSGSGNGCFVRVYGAGFANRELAPEQFGSSESPSGNSISLQKCADILGQLGGGYIAISDPIEYVGPLNLHSNVGIVGRGFSSELINTGTSGQDAIIYSGTGADTTSTDRIVGQSLRDFSLVGNVSSGNGLVVQLSGATDNGVLDRKPTTPDFNHIKISGHGGDGVVIGNSASFGAGNLFPFKNCQVSYNGGRGFYVQGQSNLVNVKDCAIHNNGSHGMHLNFITSTCSIVGNIIMDNDGWGVFAFSAEEPLIQFNGFNRNKSGAVALSGNSTKSTEAAVIFANLFGDNGGGATQREVSIVYSKGTSVKSNYFYGTGQDQMIYLGDEVNGCDIDANHFKDLTTELKLVIKDAATNTFYRFVDSVSQTGNIESVTNQLIEYKMAAIATIFRSKAPNDANARFTLKASGEMSWGDGALPPDVFFKRTSSSTLTSITNNGTTAANLGCGRMELQDDRGATAKSGYTRIYMDIDGALKAINSSGVISVLATF